MKARREKSEKEDSNSMPSSTSRKTRVHKRVIQQLGLGMGLFKFKVTELPASDGNETTSPPNKPPPPITGPAITPRKVGSLDVYFYQLRAEESQDSLSLAVGAL
jgi:hypothetical protein